MAQHDPSARKAHLSFERLESRLALSGTGLTAQYFHNSDFTGLADIRTEGVSHNWGSGSPGAGIDADSFSVRWSGQVMPQYSQTYTFNVLSDEGVRVWVDGKMLVDDWIPHVRRNQSGTIALQANQLYDIRIDYFEATGPAQMQLSWSSASQVSQIIPIDRLYQSPSGLLGSYTDNASGAITRIDPTVDFDWGAGSPNVAIKADNFNATWTGQLFADYSQSYTFSTRSDDGVRLWIGNELIIDDWNIHGPTDNFGAKQLEAGKLYDVRVEYFESVGGAQIALKWSSADQTSDSFEAIPQSHLRATKATPVTFQNPLGVGADPFVVQWNGNYYMTMTTDGHSVQITRAAALQDIHTSNGADAVTAWTAPAGTNYSDQVWAPELHHIGSSWYIYVAASNGDNATHRMHVLERDADDPFGPFFYKGQLAATTDRWAIDGTVFDWQGIYYFVWSGWPGSTDGQQNLYIAQMRNPWTLLGDRVLLSTPQFSWERNGMPINEGPEAFVHNGQLNIIYSASGYWTPQYALGRLTYNGTGSLLNAANWSKAAQPVFQSGNGVVGVGHASFTKSPDGTEDWIVYHAHRNPAPPAGQEIRDIRIQPFTFNADNTPNFGPPLPLSQTIEAPSTGPDPNQVPALGDYNADLAIGAADYDTWRATYANSLFPGISADGNRNGVVDAADYVLWRKQASLVGSGTQASAVVQPSESTLPQLSAGAVTTSIVARISNPQPAENVAEPELFSPESRRTTRPAIASTSDIHTESALDQVFSRWLLFMDSVCVSRHQSHD